MYECVYICMYVRVYIRIYRLPTVSAHYERQGDQYNQLLPVFTIV